MTVTEIMEHIHEEGVENEIFELLTQWMIADRFEYMKIAHENKATVKAINKIATQNRNARQAIEGIISLSQE